jgi:hypothetical protein
MRAGRLFASGARIPANNLDRGCCLLVWARLALDTGAMYGALDDMAWQIAMRAMT